jgi:hypothetical protein
MQIEVRGTRLWFDVDGPALVPDGGDSLAVTAEEWARCWRLFGP